MKKTFRLLQILFTVLMFAGILSLSACGKNTTSSSSSGSGGSGGDRNPPTAPTGLTAKAISQSEITLRWNPATDDRGVQGYYVYREGVEIRKINGGSNTSYTNTNLDPDTEYCYTVSAFDRANESAPSEEACTKTLVVDNTPPSTPTGLTATTVSPSEIELSWEEASDNVGVTSYLVYNASSGTLIDQVNSTSFSISGLNPSTTYCFRVSAKDAAGNESPKSEQACTTTLDPCTDDTEAPSVPTGLTATAVSSTQINLAWNKSTDECGINSYNVYNFDGTFLKAATTNSTAITGLTPNTQYCFKVSAKDSSGNESAQSEQACATTPAADLTLTSGNATKAVSAVSTSLTLPAVLDDLALQFAFVIQRGIIFGQDDFFDIFKVDIKTSYKALHRRTILKKDFSFSKSPKQKTGVVRISETLPTTTISCIPDDFNNTSGTATLVNTTYSEDADSNIVGATSTITFNNCRPFFQNQNLVLNGIATISINGFIFEPTKYSFSTQGILSYYDPSANDDLIFTNFNEETSGINRNEFGLLTEARYSLNGFVSGIVDSNPINTEFQDYLITYNSSDTGETYQISGNMTPSCLGFSINVTTNIPLFISWSEFCPTAGRILITADTNTVEANIATNQQITVSFNGTPVQTFTDCNEGEGLCGN